MVDLLRLSHLDLTSPPLCKNGSLPLITCANTLSNYLFPVLYPHINFFEVEKISMAHFYFMELFF